MLGAHVKYSANWRFLQYISIGGEEVKGIFRVGSYKIYRADIFFLDPMKPTPEEWALFQLETGCDEELMLE